MQRVVIIGAGISGLALAFRLHQIDPELDVTILEQSDRAGGTMWTEERDGFRIEVGPNGFLDTKRSTVGLCRDLGLGDRLIPATDAAAHHRYLFLDGKLKALPGGFGAFLRTDLLTWRGKLSFLAERFRPRKTSNDDESIGAFARRRAGPEVADVFADALVTGIHAGDSEILSVRATFPRLVAMEEQYGSVLKGFARQARERRHEAKARGEPSTRPGRMWSFPVGLRLLIETLVDKLPRKPIYGASVRRLDRGKTGWRVLGDGRDEWIGDAIVLACPAYQQADIVVDLDPELAREIGCIAYNRIAVVALGYRQQNIPICVDGFGFIVPQRSRRDILGVQWCSSIFPDRAPAEHVLLRAMCGGWHRPEIVDWDDDRLLAAVRAELRAAMRIEAPPVFHRIIRWHRAIPQYHLGHLDRVARIEAATSRHPGLFVTGNAYHGVALNDCTEQAERLAHEVSAYLRVK